MTNFSELKKQNPLSFRLFEQWVEQNYETTLNIWNGTIRNEDVVDFLDEQRFYILVHVYYGEHESFRWAVSSVVPPDYVSDRVNTKLKTRPEATIQAIKKAFELLENKLKQN